MLAALAVFTFALENALFLAYPHRQRSQGIAMVLRTKLTFLGKVDIFVGCCFAASCLGVIVPIADRRLGW